MLEPKDFFLDNNSNYYRYVIINDKHDYTFRVTLTLLSVFCFILRLSRKVKRIKRLGVAKTKIKKVAEHTFAASQNTFMRARFDNLSNGCYNEASLIIFRNFSKNSFLQFYVSNQ